MPDNHWQSKGSGWFVLRCLRCLVILSLILLLCHTASFALSPEAQQTAEGIGTIIEHNQAAARSKAINDALRRALEQTLSTILDPSELMANAQVVENALYDKTLIYIRNYRVLWEYPDLQLKVYRVGIEANLALSEIEKTVQTLGILQSEASKIRLLVLIMEHRLERPYPSPFDGSDGVVAQTLRSFLDAHNFQTVRPMPEVAWDGRESAALIAGKRAGAEAVVIGQAKTEKVGSDVVGMPLQTVNASVEVQVLATATGQRIATEHIEATAIHTDAVLGGTQALRKAATEVASRLISPLRQHLTIHAQSTTP
jgi:plasmid stabilization system protein ParE